MIRPHISEIASKHECVWGYDSAFDVLWFRRVICGTIVEFCVDASGDMSDLDARLGTAITQRLTHAISLRPGPLHHRLRRYRGRFRCWTQHRR